MLANQVKPRHLLIAAGLGNASSMHCTVSAQVQLMVFHLSSVTFEWNVLLDLSGEAATKSFGMLSPELSLKVLSESTRTMAIWVIHVGEGVGDIPGIQGDSGGL